jgi:hypothetical protein
MHPRILQLKLFGTYHFACATIGIITLISDPIIFSSKHHHLSPASSVIAGTTVILGGVAVAMLGSRCNAVTVMVLNLAATPLELSLIIPFLRLGEAITGSGHFPLTADALKNVLTGHASKDVLLSIVHAMLGWLIAAPFVLGVLYMVSVPCFKVLVDRFGGIPSSPRTPIKAV